MKWSLILIFQFLTMGAVWGSDTIFTYLIEEEIGWNLRLTDSMQVFVDADGVYGINDVLALPESSFRRLDQKERTSGSTYSWSRIRMKNSGTETRLHYFHLCNDPDSIWVYTIEYGRVINEQFTGSSLPPSQKSIPAAQNYIPYSLDAGQQRDYYFRLHFPDPTEQKHLSELFIKPGQALVQFLSKKYATQAFYAGIMILFGLVSLFMFGMFRERAFIYFTLVMFFFMGYFLCAFGIIDTLFTYRYPEAFYTNQQIFISGIVISFSLFVAQYLELKSHFPRYTRLYLYFYVFVAAFAHFAALFSDNRIAISIANNVFIFLWILFITTFIIVLARRKNKAGRILLLSIIMLGLGSFVQILMGMGLLPRSILTEHAMQSGTILFSGVLFYGLFDRINTIRNEKERFEALDQLKSRFFANISHEFRTPLTLVMGPVQQVMEVEENPKKHQLLKLANQNAGRLLQLINQLLDLSKLEAGKMELKIKECNFSVLLKGITMSFESLAERRNIRLHFVSQSDDILLFADQNKMEQIFYNLLSNAFKFTKENGEVSVMITEGKEQVQVRVRDTGIGIPAERLPYIFNRFYQVDSSETREQEGTGIGLALVKELVLLHQGKIKVESADGKGTTFVLSLPKGKVHFKEEDFATVDEPDHYPFEPSELAATYAEASTIDAEEGASDAQATVLIVEDNADVRAYIRQHLTMTFQVMEAVNGQEGIDMALEHQPDLVISDVMMPLKNGYEVCETLKTDERTSHIPIILLTAKAAQEEKMLGLETGADDYLLKPFNTRELEIRIRNLIEIRRRLRQRFAQADTFEPEQLGHNAVDKVFLEKICAIVEAHLADEQFGVELFAEEMGMSRGHLNRKLKALTDESANKFIRSFRLQRAMALLRKREGNVSEIAFATGFGSTAYFVKCFGDKYGKTPGAILQE